MNQPIQSLTDFLTAKPGVSGLKKPLTETSRSLDLSGVEEALKGFDTYLQDVVDQNGALQGKAKSDLSELGLDGLEPGNIGLIDGNVGGKTLPYESQQLPESANYITAANNLVADLSANKNSMNALTAESSTANTEKSYGVFDSPLYKTLIGADQSVSGVSNSDTAIEQSLKQVDQNAQHLKSPFATNTNGPSIAANIGSTGFSGALNNQKLSTGSISNSSQNAIQNDLLGLNLTTQTHHSNGASLSIGIGQDLTSNLSFESLQNSVLSMQSGLASHADSTLNENTANLADEALELVSHKDPNASTLTAGAKALDANHQILRMKMDTPVQQDGWNREFAMKISSLTSAGEQSASLQLHPSELGSIEISMTTEGDKAKVHFVVQTAGAREALENSLQKLREFFEESGMTLSDTGVEDQSDKSGLAGQQEHNHSNTGSSAAEVVNGIDSEDGSTDAINESINGRLDNVVDYYI